MKTNPGSTIRLNAVAPELANSRVLSRIDSQLDDTVPAKRPITLLPLMYQPGERWAYNTSCDVMGVLVARVSRKSFETFLRERLFDPLGMKDTAFSVPASKLDRLPGVCRFNHDGKKLEPFDSEQIMNTAARRHLNQARVDWYRRSTTTTRPTE